MEDPKPTPCLMGLPAELRNAIWEMVFEGNVREIDKGTFSTANNAIIFLSGRF